MLPCKLQPTICGSKGSFLIPKMNRSVNTYHLIWHSAQFHHNWQQLSSNVSLLHLHDRPDRMCAGHSKQGIQRDLCHHAYGSHHDRCVSHGPPVRLRSVAKTDTCAHRQAVLVPVIEQNSVDHCRYKRCTSGNFAFDTHSSAQLVCVTHDADARDQSTPLLQCSQEQRKCVSDVMLQPRTLKSIRCVNTFHIRIPQTA